MPEDRAVARRRADDERRARREARKVGRPVGSSHQDVARERIRYGMCINRLQNFVAGRIEMSAHQVTAALGLLRKGVPDLQAIEHAGFVEHDVQHTISDQPMSDTDWAAKYGGAGEPATH